MTAAVAPQVGPGRRGAAVLGRPIAHSLSPVLHRVAYDALGLTGWTYDAYDCDASTLAVTLHRLDAEGLAGVSLTMPLKRAVLPLLARAERTAADVGAANTVLFGGIAGEWWGANTDVPGMIDVLRAAGATSVERAVVLGGGATAASTLAALADLGVRDISVRARRPEAAQELHLLGQSRGLTVTVLPWPEPGEDWGAPLVVSTVPAGAGDGLAVTGASGLLFDVVYAPWPTALAQAWAVAGGAVIGGLELLVAQAAHQITLLTGRVPPADVMRQAGLRALAAR